MLLVDGDNLRAYNEMGYEHGNQMIRALGDVIGAAVRYGDRAARWLSGDIDSPPITVLSGIECSRLIMSDPPLECERSVLSRREVAAVRRSQSDISSR